MTVATATGAITPRRFMSSRSETFRGTRDFWQHSPRPFTAAREDSVRCDTLIDALVENVIHAARIFHSRFPRERYVMAA